MRINRFLAAAGLGSRRSCEELVRAGRVSINGNPVESLATVVSGGDTVRVGRRIVRAKANAYLLLYKPAGYITTRSDERSRKTVYDLLPPNMGNLFHIGRLDKESEGLILFTNDGDFGQELAHPSHRIEKEYEVVVDAPFDRELIPKLLRGVTIEAGRAKMESVYLLGPRKLKITLKQGLKRQIRDSLWQVGYRVERLVRTRIGPLRDPDIRPGTCRFLDRKEIEALRRAAARAQGEDDAVEKVRPLARRKARAGKSSPSRRHG